MYMDRTSQERKNEARTTSKLNDLQFPIRSWVIVETSIENEELNVNFCQSSEFFITLL